jgi:hypothetical protein
MPISAVLPQQLEELHVSGAVHLAGLKSLQRAVITATAPQDLQVLQQLSALQEPWDLTLRVEFATPSTEPLKGPAYDGTDARPAQGWSAWRRRSISPDSDSRESYRKTDSDSTDSGSPAAQRRERMQHDEGLQHGKRCDAMHHTHDGTVQRASARLQAGGALAADGGVEFFVPRTEAYEHVDYLHFNPPAR